MTSEKIEEQNNNKTIITGTVVEPLSSAETYNHPDPLVRTYTRVRLVSHLPANEDGIYMSIPLAEGRHIGDDPMNRKNLDRLLAEIMLRYKQKGGCSALVKAAPGSGKTYFMIETLAAILGEKLNTEIYMDIPITPTVAQQEIEHDCDVMYGSVKVEEPGKSPIIRCYIYDHAKDIRTVTDHRLAGVENPVIMIIDEAHYLMTETAYRNKTLRSIIEKAKKILEAGGVVIAMTASTDTISATIPYNSRSGYDIICHFFGVSSDKPLITDTGIMEYPNYGYRDLDKWGADSGVALTSPIFADRIRVIYPQKDQSVFEALLGTIEDLLDDGRKVIVEYNDTARLLQIKRKLKELGYKAEVCCGKDKHFEVDEASKVNIYDNPAYHRIINSRDIDYGEYDIILSTKLLENGTTINDIFLKDADENEKKKIKSKVTTVFCYRQRSDMDFEPHDQFASRIRFRHDEAVIITDMPFKSAEEASTADRDFYNEKEINKVVELIDLLQDGSIPRSRLSYIDLRSKEDLPLNISPSGVIDAETIARTVTEAGKKYYKFLMFNRTLFEERIKAYYHDKDVTFEIAKNSSIDVTEKHPPISAEEKNALKEVYTEAFKDSDIRSAYVNGKGIYYKDGRSQTMPGTRELLEMARPNYIDTANKVTEIALTLQDISALQELKNSERAVIEIPEKYSKDEYVTTLTDAISEIKPTGLKKLLNESTYLGFQYIGNYTMVFKVIMNYAERYGTMSYEVGVEKAITDCVAVLTGVDPDLKALISNLIRHLFNAPIKKPLDRLVCCSKLINELDMNDYIRLTNYTVKQIEALTIAIEVTSFVMFPGQTLEESSDAGATYRAITSATAFKEATGREYDHTKGLKSWEGVTITKAKADVIYSAAVRELRKNHKSFNNNSSEGRLAVLRLFASAFTYTKKEYKEKDPTTKKTKNMYKYILRNLREKAANNYDEIVNLTFQIK